jgi:hypothetical protein
MFQSVNKEKEKKGDKKMPKSLQIFFARVSSISTCLGTVLGAAVVS